MIGDLEGFSWHLASEFSERMPEKLRSADREGPLSELVCIDLSGKQAYGEIQEFIQNVLDIRKLFESIGFGATEVGLKLLIFQELSGLSEEDILQRRGYWSKKLAQAEVESEQCVKVWRQTALRMVEVHARRKFERFLKKEKIPDTINARWDAAFDFQRSERVHWPQDDPIVEAAMKASRDALQHSNFVGTLRKRLELWTTRWGWPALWYLYKKEIKSVLYEATLRYQKEMAGLQPKERRPVSGLNAAPLPSRQREPSLNGKLSSSRLPDRIRDEYNYTGTDLVEILLAVSWLKSRRRSNAKLAALMTHKAKIQYVDGKTPLQRLRDNPDAFRSHLKRLRNKARDCGFFDDIPVEYLRSYEART